MPGFFHCSGTRLSHADWRKGREAVEAGISPEKSVCARRIHVGQSSACRGTASSWHEGGPDGLRVGTKRCTGRKRTQRQLEKQHTRQEDSHKQRHAPLIEYNCHRQVTVISMDEAPKGVNLNAMLGFLQSDEGGMHCLCGEIQKQNSGTENTG